MSKPVKNLITESYRRRFGALDGAVLIDIRGIKSNKANDLRAGLAAKKIKVTVVKNSLARLAIKGTALDGIGEMLQGPNAMVFGGESVVSVARALIEATKEMEGFVFKGAIMDGQVFAADQIKALSEYPTKDEAQAKVVTLILSPARKLVGQITSPGAKLAALVKAIQEKKEKEGAVA